MRRLGRGVWVRKFLKIGPSNYAFWGHPKAKYCVPPHPSAPYRPNPIIAPHPNVAPHLHLHMKAMKATQEVRHHYGRRQKTLEVLGDPCHKVGDPASLPQAVMWYNYPCTTTPILFGKFFCLSTDIKNGFDHFQSENLSLTPSKTTGCSLNIVFFP